MSYTAHILANYKQLVAHKEAIAESEWLNHASEQEARAWKELRIAATSKSGTISKVDVAFISRADSAEESFAIQQILDKMKVEYITID